MAVRSLYQFHISPRIRFTLTDWNNSSSTIFRELEKELPVRLSYFRPRLQRAAAVDRGWAVVVTRNHLRTGIFVGQRSRVKARKRPFRLPIVDSINLLSRAARTILYRAYSAFRAHRLHRAARVANIQSHPAKRDALINTFATATGCDLHTAIRNDKKR